MVCSNPPHPFSSRDDTEEDYDGPSTSLPQDQHQREQTSNDAITQTTQTHQESAQEDPAAVPSSIKSEQNDGRTIYYCVTGSTAHSRIVPLLPSHWVNVTRTTTALKLPKLNFVWENAPRKATQSHCNTLACYSHLPNGTRILDDKWVLAKLFAHDAADSNETSNHLVGNLETHCFQGIRGFWNWVFQQQRQKQQHAGKDSGQFEPELNHGDEEEPVPSHDHIDMSNGAEDESSTWRTVAWPDLAWPSDRDLVPLSMGKDVAAIKESSHWWVIKDASCNGAGGIWFVDVHEPSTWTPFLRAVHHPSTTYSTSPTMQQGYHQAFQVKDESGSLKTTTTNGSFPSSISSVGPTNSSTTEKRTNSPSYSSPPRFVAQRYVLPMVLYHGRKCHVRVYATITCHGQAFVHEQAFLHVANQPFVVGGNNQSQPDPEQHLTNCCANSHNAALFAGEICANLQLTRTQQRQQQLQEHSNKTEVLIQAETMLDQGQQAVVALGEFYPSIAATVAALAKRAMPFLDGGQANGGFEYLGLDFILSTTSSGTHMAYLLEVNAPPSQDTATGLPHAERVHNTVLQDWIHHWIIPHVEKARQMDSDTIQLGPSGGWRCVYEPPVSSPSAVSFVPKVPSKAMWLNRIKWALFEQKLDKQLEKQGKNIRKGASAMKDLLSSQQQVDQLTLEARQHFAYYTLSSKTHSKPRPMLSSSTKSPNPSSHVKTPFVFFENAGGTQVPQSVVDRMTTSLQQRHRAVIGKASVERAHAALYEFMDTNSEHFEIGLGTNATSLLAMVASTVQLSSSRRNPDNEHPGQKPCQEVGDLEASREPPLHQEQVEIVIAVENHMANVTPWLNYQLQQQHNLNQQDQSNPPVRIKWWTIQTENKKVSTAMPRGDTSQTEISDTPSADIDSSVEDPCTWSRNLKDLMNERTRIVAISHASNVLGELRDLHKIGRLVRAHAPHARIVVDGVAAVPHVHVSLNELVDCVDYYVWSCHKVFGPHCGVLFHRKRENSDMREGIGGGLGGGTANYEACEGIVGMVEYFKQFGGGNIPNAFHKIEQIEQALAHRLLEGLRLSPRVEILESSLSLTKDKGSCSDANFGTFPRRLPLVSLKHSHWSSPELEKACHKAGFICRSGTFLATDQLLDELLSPQAEDCVGEKTKTNDKSGESDKITAGTDENTLRRPMILRFSMVHYNALHEVEQLLDFLYSLPGWF